MILRDLIILSIGNSGASFKKYVQNETIVIVWNICLFMDESRGLLSIPYLRVAYGSGQVFCEFSFDELYKNFLEGK